MADRSFLSWPFLEPRHQALHDRVEAWAGAHVAALSGDGETSAAAAATVRRLAAAMGKEGFLATAVGGRDGSLHGPLDTRSLCICRDVLARHAGLADFAFAMQGLGTGPIGLFGTPEQKERWLPSVARGTTISAFALSEAEAGSDVSALAMRAQRDGDDWRLDGAKTWISNAGIADLYVVFARTGEAPGAKGLSAFVVEAGAPGFSVAKTIDLIAPHPIGALRFRRGESAARPTCWDRRATVSASPWPPSTSSARPSAPPPSASRAGRWTKRCAMRARASCSASLCPISSSRAPSSPTWRSPSTPRRC